MKRIAPDSEDTGRSSSKSCDEASAAWVHIARFAGEAVGAYKADPARVYVGGFSQGGIIALTALLTAPEAFAGAFCLIRSAPSGGVAARDA